MSDEDGYGFTGLDLPRRAAALGISCRAYCELVSGDHRIVADAAVATTHALRRLRAWIAAGKPDADAGEIAFHGDDGMRAIAIETIAALPGPVRWHAVRHVTLFEIGRTRGGVIAGYMTSVELRSGVDDSPHVIVLDGRTPDEAIPPLLAHELGHALHRPHRPPGALTPGPRMTELEIDARVLAVFDGDRITAAREMFRGELLANDCASAWGYPTEGILCPDAMYFQLFIDRMDRAADLADDIARRLDEECPMPEARAAAACFNTNEETRP